MQGTPHNHTPAIQSSSQSHSSNRPFADGGVTGEYRVPLRCCSQAVTKGRAVGFRFPIVRSATSAVYVTDCSALPVVITLDGDIGCKLTEKARRGRYYVECSVVDPRGSQRRTIKTERSMKKEVRRDH
jgi:hypothetical protein